MAWVAFLVALATVVAGCVGVSVLLDWAVSGSVPRLLRPVARLLERARDPFRRRPEPLPPVLLSLELVRISAELAKVEAGNQPAKATRVNACRWAYDRVLLEYCHAVDVPVPTEQVPLSEHDRLELETALVGAGHGW